MVVMDRMRGVIKNPKFDWLGCSIEEYKVYLESQFGDQFTWENYCEIWELDHLRPIGVKGITDEERIKRLHYLNTRPLTIHENRTKSTKEL